VKNLFVVAVENVAVCMQDNRLRKDSGVKYVFEANTICDFWLKVSDSMGVGRIFSREGPLLDFTKFLLGGAKVVKFVFSYSKQNKQPFLLKFSKSKGGQVPVLPSFRCSCLIVIHMLEKKLSNVTSLSLHIFM